jgi:hypothetical protein
MSFLTFWSWEFYAKASWSACCTVAAEAGGDGKNEPLQL